MRGMGFIPDLLAHVEEDALLRPMIERSGESSLAGVTPYFASSRDYRHLIDAVKDQGRTNSCWAQFISSATYLAGQAQGLPMRRPSVLWAYAVGRYASTPGILVDLGTQPRPGLLGLEEHGLVAEADWPFNPSEVNDAPPFTLDTIAADAKLTGYHLIDDASSSPDQMRAALDKGHFPGLALEVHESFNDHNGSDVYDEPRGDRLGLHMVTCVGYRPGAILILNSWGTSWGDFGCAWLSDRFVRSHYAKHRCVITTAPAALAV